MKTTRSRLLTVTVRSTLALGMASTVGAARAEAQDLSNA